MDISEFEATLTGDEAPRDLSPSLRSLWTDGKGDPDRAHDLVQDETTTDAAWVHAYLHRKEGDLPNAGYWYRQCGRPEAAGSLEEEWRAIVTELLRDNR